MKTFKKEIKNQNLSATITISFDGDNSVSIKDDYFGETRYVAQGADREETIKKIASTVAAYENRIVARMQQKIEAENFISGAVLALVFTEQQQ